MFLRRFGPTDALIAFILVSALWLPIAVGGKAWKLALVLLPLAAVWKGVRLRRLGPPAPFLIAYLAVYGVAALHGGTLSTSDATRYFLKPIAALAVATLVTTVAQRRRALWLMIAVVAVEIPVTAGQAGANLVRYGRDATDAADSVVGALGGSQAGIVTLVAVAVAALVAGAWLADMIRSAVAIAAGAALIAVGVFSSTRAVLAFVVVSTVAIVAVSLTLGARRPPARRLVGLLAVSLAILPLIYVGTRAIYPEAYVGALSSQKVDVLGGAAAQGIHPAPPGGGAPTTPKAPPGEAPSSDGARGVQLLPGRFAQIELAARVSVKNGVVVAAIGRGPGTTELDPRYRMAQEVPNPQRTGSTWLGRILTEAGWLGLVAFFALLAWMALLGHRLSRRAVDPADRALGAALPGVAALTAIASAFTTILDVRGYAAVFWLLVGLAISADRDALLTRVREGTSPG